MKRIPFYKQLNRDYCGPAIVKMILGAYGIERSQHELAKELKTPRDPDHGTSIKNLESVIKKYGFDVRASQRKTVAALRQKLAEGCIAVICYTEPVAELGHYAIVKKIAGGKITLIDPDSRTGRTSLLVEEFERRWKDPLFTKTVRWAAFVSPKK